MVEGGTKLIQARFNLESIDTHCTSGEVTPSVHEKSDQAVWQFFPQTNPSCRRKCQQRCGPRGLAKKITVRIKHLKHGIKETFLFPFISLHTNLGCQIMILSHSLTHKHHTHACTHARYTQMHTQTTHSTRITQTYMKFAYAAVFHAKSKRSRSGIRDRYEHAEYLVAFSLFCLFSQRNFGVFANGFDPTE